MNRSFCVFFILICCHFMEGVKVEAFTPTPLPTIQTSWELTKKLPCKGIFPSEEGKARKRCKSGQPRSAKKSGKEPILDRGYYDLNLNTCLKKLVVDNETTTTTLRSNSQCSWYWCASENGCVRSNYGELCSSTEKLSYVVLTCVMFIIFALCILVPILAEYEDEILIVVTIISLISGVLFSLAWSECDNVYPFTVVYDGGSVPTPSPIPLVVTPLPTLTHRPTFQPTWIPGVLSENISFQSTELELVSIIFFVLLGTFALRTFHFVWKLDNLDRSRKLKIFITLLFSQLDIFMDFSYTFYSKFAAPFLRLMSMMFLFLPFFVICCAHYQTNMSKLNKIIGSFKERKKDLIQNKILTLRVFKLTNSFYNKENRVCKFDSLVGFVVWTIGCILLNVIDIVLSVLFTTGCIFFIIAQVVYAYFYVASKLSILDAGMSPKVSHEEKEASQQKDIEKQATSSSVKDDSEEKQKIGNFKFNESLFSEIVFESVPQLIVASINEVALQDDKNKLSTLFLLQVITSSLMIVNEIWPMASSILNNHCKIGKGLASRLLFERVTPPSSSPPTLPPVGTTAKSVIPIGKLGRDNSTGSVVPSSSGSIHTEEPSPKSTPMSDARNTKQVKDSKENDGLTPKDAHHVSVELVPSSMSINASSHASSEKAQPHKPGLPPTEPVDTLKEEYQYHSTNKSSEEYNYSKYDKESRMLESHIVKSDGTIDMDALNAEIDKL